MASSISNTTTTDLFPLYQRQQNRCSEFLKNCVDKNEIDMHLNMHIGYTSAILELSGYDQEKLTIIFKEIFELCSQSEFERHTHLKIRDKKISVSRNDDTSVMAKCRFCDMEFLFYDGFELHHENDSVTFDEYRAHKILSHGNYGYSNYDVNPLQLAKLMYVFADIEKEIKPPSELYVNYRAKSLKKSVKRITPPLDVKAILYQHRGYTQAILESEGYQAEYLSITLRNIYLFSIKQILFCSEKSSYVSSSPLQKITVVKKEGENYTFATSECLHCGVKHSVRTIFTLQNEGGSVDLDKVQVHGILCHGDYGLNETDANPLDLAKVLYASANTAAPTEKET